MPDRLTLGSTPADMTVWLVADAPFAASVTADAAFPAAPELVFDVGGTLASTLSGDSLTAAWLLTAEQVDALTTAGPSRVTLRDPGTHHAYAAGRVYTRVIVGSGAPSSVPSTGALTVDTLDGNLTLTYSTAEVDPAEIEAAVVDYLTANPPASAVESVNGEVGIVVLNAADVGADPAGTAATAVAGVTVASIGAATAAQGAKADTAVQPADLTPYATDADLSGHASDTTAVHGIADTAALVLTTDARLSDARTPTAHTHDDRYFTEAEVTASLAGKANTSHTHAAADVTSGTLAVARLGSGTPAAGTYVDGGTGAWTALPAGGGGGVTDHGALTGLGDDDHTQYALADGSRGSFAAPLGADDNYVTDAEKAALHAHSNKAALDLVSGTNTGDQDLSGYATTASLATVATSGSYDDLTDKPSIPSGLPTTINSQTGAYTLVSGDAVQNGTAFVAIASSTAVDLTVPANVFSAGHRVDIADRGTARVTVLAGAGMTVNPPAGGSLVMEGRYAYASLVFISATEADLVGLVAAP